MTTETFGRALSIGSHMAGKSPVGIWLDGAESAEAEPRDWLWVAGMASAVSQSCIFDLVPKYYS